MSQEHPFHDRRGSDSLSLTSEHDQAHAENGEGWLVSYADMMTLLFGLFVLLFSISSVDQKKYEELQKVVSQQFMSKTEYHSPVEAVAKDLTDRLAKSGLNLKDIEVSQSATGLQISLRGSAFFESGKTELLAQGAGFVDQVGDAVLKSSLDYEIRVEGHTDDAPMASVLYPSNWDLSAARAVGVVRRLESRGVPSERLVAAGFGASRPIALNRTVAGVPIPENMSKNRRIVIEVGLRSRKGNDPSPSAHTQGNS